MAQVSKYPLSEAVYERIFEIFFKSIAAIKDQSEATELVHSLLTPTERVMLAKRLAIAFLLEKEYTYRDIQKVLRVSLGTIGVVSGARKFGSAGYTRIVTRLIHDERVSEFVNSIVVTLISISARGSKGGAWRYLKHELQREKTRSRKPFQ